MINEVIKVNLMKIILIFQKKNLFKFQIDFPTSIKQVKKFERLNTISINVFSFVDTYLIYPLYVSKVEKYNFFYLLIFSDEKISHFCYINHFSRLISSRKTRHCNTLLTCKFCNFFGQKPNKFKSWGNLGLEEHKDICGKYELDMPIMLEEGDVKLIQFKHFFPQ